VPSRTEDKNRGTKERLNEKLKDVFEQFTKPRMNIMLRDTNSELEIKWGLHETSNEKRKNLSRAERSTIEKSINTVYLDLSQ
jgi:hypothetical protein